MRCPKCGSGTSWILGNGRRRCARCRFDWRPGRLPLRLTLAEWRALLRWFARGMTSARIAHETRLDRKRVLRALIVVREAMTREVPGLSRRVSEAEHVWDAARLRRPRAAGLGLHTAHGHVWADVLSDADTERLERLVRGRQAGQPLVWHSPTRYAAMAYRGRLYRISVTGVDRRPAPFGPIEGFWAYLRRQLRAKGGIRRARLGLYVAEYAWRYNHRTLTPDEQRRALLRLIREQG